MHSQSPAESRVLSDAIRISTSEWFVPSLKSLTYSSRLIQASSGLGHSQQDFVSASRQIKHKSRKSRLHPNGQHHASSSIEHVQHDATLQRFPSFHLLVKRTVTNTSLDPESSPNLWTIITDQLSTTHGDGSENIASWPSKLPVGSATGNGCPASSSADKGDASAAVGYLLQVNL